MEWLNYHHLLYFWTVAKEGGISKAADKLMLAPATISAQIKALETSLGEQLFDRSGRQLVPTEMGRLVFDYAQEIFALGQELTSAVKQQAVDRPLTLNIGVTGVVPRLIVREVLAPAFTMKPAATVTCREGVMDDMLADLGTFRLDMLLSDRAAPPASKVRVFSHILGESPIAFFGAGRLAKRLADGFPDSLEDAPALLPNQTSGLRRTLDRWFALQGVQPRTVAEFEDSALLKVFGSDGTGFFAAPTVIARSMMTQYNVELIGMADGCVERFYAISTDRKLRHPAVVAVTQAARATLFA